MHKHSQRWWALAVCISLLAFRAVPALPRDEQQESAEPRFSNQARQAEVVAEAVQSALQQRLEGRSIDLVHSLAGSSFESVLEVFWKRCAAGNVDDELAFRMADVLAFIATDRAAAELSRLAHTCNSEFGRALPRLLRYAIGRNNPYQIAYAMLERDPQELEAIRDWIKEDLKNRPDALTDWGAAIASRATGGSARTIVHDDVLVIALAGAWQERNWTRDLEVQVEHNWQSKAVPQ